MALLPTLLALSLIMPEPRINAHHLPKADADLIALHIAVYASGMGPDQERQVAEAISTLSRVYKFDPYWILAIIKVESGFFPRYRTLGGKFGLFGIPIGLGYDMATQLGVPWQGPDTLYDPVINIEFGFIYLHWLRTRFGSVPSDYLSAFYFGPESADQAQRMGYDLPDYYARKVAVAYRRIKMALD